MANILDQKQEVISIELTKAGRKLLALGYFQPKYFAFYDDTVLYDLKYTGVEENSNDSQVRILDESLTLRSLNLSEDYLRDRLGTSNPMSDYAPAWSLKVLNGSIEYLNANSSYYRKRFNLLQDIKYKIIFDEQDMQSIPDVKEDYLLIDLQELNISDDIENFEIEVFTYDELSGGKAADLKRRLMFTEKKSNIINGILYEDKELPSNYFNIKVDKNDVAYYYDILVDDEIDTDFIEAKEKTIKDKTIGTYKTDYTGPIDPKC